MLEKEIDKLNYLKGLIRISKADGVVDENEKAYFDLAAVGLNLSEEMKTELDNYWNITNYDKLQFSSKEVALFFLQEAIQICYVDNNYDISERNEMKKIATELNINLESLKRIEDWVEEGYLWKAKGVRLLEELMEVE